MPARHLLIANGPAINPGAVATAQAWTVTGKTQGPCDYVDAHIAAGYTATTVLHNNIYSGIDRVEVTIDSSADGGDANTGSIFYTLFGQNLAYAAPPTGYGMLQTVSRMLFKMDPYLANTLVGTVAVNFNSCVVRLPVGKNAPVTMSVRVYIGVTTNWAAAAWVYTGGYLTTMLYAHLVDSCADLKISQTSKTGFGPNADSELVSVPDKAGYWFIGYALDIRNAALNAYLDNLGGGIPGVAVDDSLGWVRVQNSDGIVFDEARGTTIKADMLEGNSPYCYRTALNLYSDVLYNLGQYFRLMPAPISAENLTMTYHPTAAGLATDVYRIVYFFSKKGQAIKAVNAQQGQTVDFGASGATNKQGSKS